MGALAHILLSIGSFVSGLANLVAERALKYIRSTTMARTVTLHPWERSVLLRGTRTPPKHDVPGMVY